MNVIRDNTLYLYVYTVFVCVCVYIIYTSLYIRPNSKWVNEINVKTGNDNTGKKVL